MSSNKKIILIVGIVLLVGCCGLGWIANLSNTSSPKATQTAVVSQAAPTNTPGQAAIIQPTATQVATATFTPVPPTETPVPPTETPAPTNTQAPTATELPTETADPDLAAIQEYAGKILPILLQIKMDMDHFTNLNTEAGSNFTLLLDDNWKKDAKNTLNELVDLSEKLGQVRPVPAKMQPAHSWLSKLGPEMRQVRQDYIDGIDNINSNSLNNAANHLHTYVQYMQNATDEIQKIAP